MPSRTSTSCPSDSRLAHSSIACMPPPVAPATIVGMPAVCMIAASVHVFSAFAVSRRARHVRGGGAERLEERLVALGDEGLVVEPDDDLGVERRVSPRALDERVDRRDPICERLARVRPELEAERHLAGVGAVVGAAVHPAVWKKALPTSGCGLAASSRSISASPFTRSASWTIASGLSSATPCAAWPARRGRATRSPGAARTRDRSRTARGRRRRPPATTPRACGCPRRPLLVGRPHRGDVDRGRVGRQAA